MTSPVGPRPAGQGTLAVLALLEWWLPEGVGDAIAGDLLEEAPSHSRWWLARQVADAAVRVPLARLRSGRHAIPLLLGALAAGIVLVAGDAAWHVVLSAVPRRAGHEAGLGWRCAMAVLAGGAASVVSWGSSRSSRRA